jgi:hypothetical protein
MVIGAIWAIVSDCSVIPALGQTCLEVGFGILDPFRDIMEHCRPLHKGTAA